MLPVTQIVTNLLWRRSRRTLRGAPASGATENLFDLQPLERRILFNTTFAVSVSGQPKATLGSDYAVNILVSGDQPSRIVVNWGDPNNPNTTTTDNGPFGTQIVEHHTYVSTYPITAPLNVTATSVHNATATSYFGLSSSFGTVGFTGSGKSTHYPDSSTGDAGGVGMAVDNHVGSTHLGYSYTVSAYKSSGGTSQFAVTRVDPTGQFDPSFGTHNGTFVIDHFSTGSTDVPLAISFDDSLGQYLAVAGKTTAGSTTTWAIAVIDTTMGPGGSGLLLWKSSSSTGLPSGQANEVLADSTDDSVYAVGTNGTPGAAGTKITVAKLHLDGASGGTLVTGPFGTGWGNAGSGIVSVATGADANYSIGNFVLDNDDSFNGASPETIVAGTTNWTRTGEGTGADMTLVELDSNGCLVSTFGNMGPSYPGVERDNFGCVVTVNNGVCAVPSFDADYSLVAWEAPGGTDYVTSIGKTNAFFDGDHVIFEQNRIDTGARNSGFGQFGDGFVKGPRGDAYSGIREGGFTDSTATVIAAGGYNGDFLVTRYNLNGGTADSTFGNGGVTYADFGLPTTATTADTAYSVALVVDSQGNPTSILLGGSSKAGTSNAQLALADFLLQNKVTT